MINKLIIIFLSYLFCRCGLTVVCMALLVISMTETVLIVRLVHKQDLQTPVPHQVKYLVLERAMAFFCIHMKQCLPLLQTVLASL